MHVKSLRHLGRWSTSPTCPPYIYKASGEKKSKLFSHFGLGSVKIVISGDRSKSLEIAQNCRFPKVKQCSLIQYSGAPNIE